LTRFSQLFIGICAALFPLFVQAETAGELSSWCRPITEASVGEDAIQFPQNPPTMQCWGAFAVIAKGITYSWHGEKIWNTCVPEPARRSELIAVFVKYLDEHPELSQEHFMDVVLESLQTKFPCP
jgi:hypothetical protein